MKSEEVKARIRQHVQKQEWERAFSLGLEVLHAQPNHDDLWQVLRQVTPKLPISFFSPAHLEALYVIVSRAPSSPVIAALLGLQALCARYPVFAAHLQLVEAGAMTAEQIDLEALAPFFGEPLFHALLRHLILPHAGMERFLTVLRRRLLSMLSEEGQELRAHHGVLTSLAVQGHINGYVYYRTPEEESLLESLQRRPHAPDVTLLLACYMPPVQESGADSEFDRFVADIQRQRQRELAAASGIEVLGGIEDAVSQAVREQYEEHPYPRWINLPDIPQETPHGLLKRLFPRFDASVLSIEEKPQILIAGCGTGKQALEAARRFPSGQVSAVDLCRASLAYAVCKTEEYRVTNIRYVQADILHLAESGDTRFDIVESCGVLHHMLDPMAGWRVLVEALKPGGLMKIALYSATARESITQCRDIIRERRIGDSEAQIRGFRHELMQQKGAQHSYPFMQAVDFFSLPECRDLLFHRQEHCFSLPEISDAIAQLGLQFIGFDVPGQAMVERYMARFPQDPYWNDLDNWHRLEQEHPLLFFGMYQFWCYKPL